MLYRPLGANKRRFLRNEFPGVAVLRNDDAACKNKANLRYASVPARNEPNSPPQMPLSEFGKYEPNGRFLRASSQGRENIRL